MLSFEVDTEIAGSPEDVWAVLTDSAHIADRDSGIVSLEGTLGLGQTVRLVNEVDPKRTFKLTVTTYDAPHTMIWSGGMPLGLFRGARTFTLGAVPAGTTFSMREEFSGPMLALIRRSLPDLQPSFEQFAAGLSAEVERRGTPTREPGA